MTEENRLIGEPYLLNSQYNVSILDDINNYLDMDDDEDATDMYDEYGRPKNAKVAIMVESFYSDIRNFENEIIRDLGSIDSSDGRIREIPGIPKSRIDGAEERFDKAYSDWQKKHIANGMDKLEDVSFLSETAETSCYKSKLSIAIRVLYDIVFAHQAITEKVILKSYSEVKDDEDDQETICKRSITKALKVLSKYFKVRNPDDWKDLDYKGKAEKLYRIFNGEFTLSYFQKELSRINGNDSRRKEVDQDLLNLLKGE